MMIGSGLLESSAPKNSTDWMISESCTEYLQPEQSKSDVMYNYYRIDCINYFVHRDFNLKNLIAHFMKAEGRYSVAIVAIPFGKDKT